MSKARKHPAQGPGLTFETLIISIRGVDQDLAAQAGRAVNISLTLCHWLIGWHIEEYGRRSVDRAQYGEKLVNRLDDELTRHAVSRCDRRELYRYRSFYLAYPMIVEALPPQFKSIVADARKSAPPKRTRALGYSTLWAGIGVPVSVFRLFRHPAILAAACSRGPQRFRPFGTGFAALPPADAGRSPAYRHARRSKTRAVHAVRSSVS